MTSPAAPARLPRVGELVGIGNQKGIVRHAGVTEFASGVWIGIELEQPVGKNNGTVKDVTYFTCEPNHGIFVRAREVKLLEDSVESAAAPAPAAPKPTAKAPSEPKETASSEPSRDRTPLRTTAASPEATPKKSGESAAGASLPAAAKAEAGKPPIAKVPSGVPKKASEASTQQPPKPPAATATAKSPKDVEKTGVDPKRTTTPIPQRPDSKAAASAAAASTGKDVASIDPKRGITPRPQRPEAKAASTPTPSKETEKMTVDPKRGTTPRPLRPESKAAASGVAKETEKIPVDPKRTTTPLPQRQDPKAAAASSPAAKETDKSAADPKRTTTPLPRRPPPDSKAAASLPSQAQEPEKTLGAKRAITPLPQRPDSKAAASPARKVEKSLPDPKRSGTPLQQRSVADSKAPSPVSKVPAKKPEGPPRPEAKAVAAKKAEGDSTKEDAEKVKRPPIAHTSVSSDGTEAVAKPRAAAPVAKAKASDPKSPAVAKAASSTPLPTTADKAASSSSPEADATPDEEAKAIDGVPNADPPSAASGGTLAGAQIEEDDSAAAVGQDELKPSSAEVAAEEKDAPQPPPEEAGVKEVPKEAAAEGQEIPQPPPAEAAAEGKEIPQPPPAEAAAEGKEIPQPPPEEAAAEGKEIPQPPPEEVAAEEEEVQQPPPEEATAEGKEVQQPPPEKVAAEEEEVQQPPPEEATAEGKEELQSSPEEEAAADQETSGEGSGASRVLPAERSGVAEAADVGELVKSKEAEEQQEQQEPARETAIDAAEASQGETLEHKVTAPSSEEQEAMWAQNLETQAAASEASVEGDDDVAEKKCAGEEETTDKEGAVSHEEAGAESSREADKELQPEELAKQEKEQEAEEREEKDVIAAAPAAERPTEESEAVVDRKEQEENEAAIALQEQEEAEAAEKARKEQEEAEAAEKARKKQEEAEEKARKEQEEEDEERAREEAAETARKEQEEAEREREEAAEKAREEAEKAAAAEKARREEERAAAAAAAKAQKEQEEAVAQAARRAKVAKAQKEKEAANISRLKAEILLEEGKLELARLREEEAEVLLAEAKEANQTEEEEDETDNKPKASEEEQVLLHQRALAKIYEDHSGAVRVLKKRIAELEHVETQLKQGVQVNDDGLQQSIDQLQSQNQTLEASAKLAAEALSERRKLCTDAEDMSQAHQDLEEALIEELQAQEEREQQLRRLARSLAMGQEVLRKKRQEARDKTAKIEVRLQTLQGHAASISSLKAAAGKVEDPRPQEFDAVLTQAQASAARLRAEFMAKCFPVPVCEDAGMGHSFECVLALHRLARKADILSSAILEHYLEDSTMLAQGLENLPVSWLSHASFVGSQCGFAAVGIAGRLQACTQQEYHTIIASPALRGCVAGEVHLDAALALLQQTGAHSESLSTMRQQNLSSLSASSAQLVSILRSLFKDQPFASWQLAGYALRALASVCAMVLLASSDAGGSRRKRWQTLFERTRKLSKSVHANAPEASRSLTAETFFLFIQGTVEMPEDELDEDGNEIADAELSPRRQVLPSSPARVPSDRSARLTQALLDGLFVQAAALQSSALAEESPSGSATDSLERALSQVETSLTVLELAAVKELSATAALDSSGSKLPWEDIQSVMQQKIEDAERRALEQTTGVQKELGEIGAAIEEMEKKLRMEKDQAAEVERKFSQSRMAAERGHLVEEDHTRLQAQATLHAERLEELRLKVENEQRAKREAEDKTAVVHQQCNELQQQLSELEERLERKYVHSQMSPDEVIALQGHRLLQQEKLQACYAKLAGEKNAERQGLETSDAHTLAFAACQKEAADVRSQLLLEQAKTTIVDLCEAKPSLSMDSKRNVMASLSDRSSQLRADVTSLLHDVSGLKALDAQVQAHAAVALTRHLQATAKAATAQAASSGARLTVPLPKSVLQKLPSSAGRVGATSVPALVDHGDWQDVHAAVL